MDIKEVEFVATSMAQKVDNVRKGKDMTMQQVADDSGVSLKTYQNFIKSGKCQLYNVIKISLALELTVEVV